MVFIIIGHPTDRRLLHQTRGEGGRVGHVAMAAAAQGGSRVWSETWSRCSNGSELVVSLLNQLWTLDDPI